MAPTRKDTAPSGLSAALSFFSFEAQTAKSRREEPEDEARNDIEGLVQFFTDLRQKGVRVRTVTYVINRWSLGGIIPMTHHGFIFKTSRQDDYFTLDFGRKGIVWDVMDCEPECPDDTLYTKVYKVDMDTYPLQKYCEDTPPFNFPFYDCETWAKGLLAILSIDKEPSRPDNKARMTKEAGAPALNQAPTKTPASPNQQKQRTGTCI